ncbi:MAG: O-antigen ligase family protein [Bacteroidetes bacterium]|nr:O-antigen ligase family protein [Bacteroidota bacterium]
MTAIHSFVILYKNFLRHYAWDVIILSTFIAALLVSSISNYTLISFIIKFVITIILLQLIYFDIRKSSSGFSVLIKSPDINNFYLLLIIFIIVPSISLFYSFNPYFGSLKILSLIISTIPLIIIFRYFLITRTAKRISVFITLLSIFVFFGTIITILFPFNYLAGQSTLFGNWSHVIYGRFIGSALVILLSIQLLGKGKNIYALAAISGLALASTIQSGLRAAVIGISITIPILIIHTIVKGKFSIQKKISLFMTILLVTFILLSIPNNFRTQQRYLVFSNPNLEIFKSDSSINPRITAYNYCIESIKEFALCGVGFGGFFSTKIGKDIAWMKYPHNIFFEIATELGVIALAGSIVLLFYVFKKAIALNFSLFLYLIFVLIQALFSKDLPSQTMLLISFALVGLKKTSAT